MIYTLSRMLQLAGLIILPVAVMGNIADPANMTLKSSLMLSAVGATVFFFGWLLQRGVKK